MPKGEKRAKITTERRGDGKRSILCLCRFFQWIMCGKGRGGDAPRALWDNKTSCLANQDRNDSPTHPSVLLSCELTSAQGALFMLGSGVCTAPFSAPLCFEMTLQGWWGFPSSSWAYHFVWKLMTLSAPHVLTGPLAPVCACVSPPSMNLLHKPCFKPQWSFTWRHDSSLCSMYLFPFLSSAENICYSKDLLWGLARHTRDASEGDLSRSSRFWIMLQPITCVGFPSSLK